MSWETSLLRRLYVYLWLFKLTRFGKVLVLFGVLAASFVAWSVEILSFYLFSALFAVGFFSFLFNLMWRTRFEMRLSMPDRVVAGAFLRAVVDVRNTGRLPAYDVGVSFVLLPAGLREVTVENYIPVLSPGESARLFLSIHAAQRGSYRLPPLRCFSAFPLRLLRSGASRLPVGNLLVLPSFTALENINVPVSPRYQIGGVALTANIGESPEYIGNRMFQAGDSIRRLDIRAWGRVGAPVVREYQEEYFLRLAVVLDTFVAHSTLRHPRRLSRLESAISLTAAMVDALSRGEYLLDIFAAGPELYNFRAGRGAPPFDNVLEILSCIEPCHTNPFRVITPALADELGNISTVLFVFLDWDKDRREMTRIAAECGCRTRVLVVREGNTTLPAESDGEISLTCITPDTLRSGGVTSL